MNQNKKYMHVVEGISIAISSGIKSSAHDCSSCHGESATTDRVNNGSALTMDCTCGSEERQKKRAIKLKRKYESLRRHHKKLLGVAIELTQVLEEYVRGQRAPNVTETLVLCSNIYPSLFDELSARTKELVLEKPKENEEVMPAEVEKVSEQGMKVEVIAAGGGDKDYEAGFWSKREIPRTPINN